MKIDKRAEGIRPEIDQAIQDLEKEGLLVKSGEYRRNRQGILEPVYVTGETYEQMKMNLNYRTRRLAQPGAKHCRPLSLRPDSTKE